MNRLFTWAAVQLDQLRGRNAEQLQVIATAAIANLPIPSFSSSFTEGALSGTSVAASSVGNISKGTQVRETDSSTAAQANVDFPATDRTFPIFKNLSAELRNMIWKLSLPGSRVVDIIYDKEQDKYLSFHSKPPTILHTTREARWAAQQVYNLCFPTESNPANIYIRFDKDTVYFTNWLTGCRYIKDGWFEHVNIGPIGKKGVGKVELKSIQRVAVNSVYFDVPKSLPAGSNMDYFMHSISPVLERFYSLKKLYVVVEDIDPYQRGEITFLKIPSNCHRHPRFCAFCRTSEIVRALENFKWKRTSSWKVPSVSVVGAARNNHVCHLGEYYLCECNGIRPPPGRTNHNHPCAAFRNLDISDVVEDDLPEEEWGLCEGELEELIADEDFYNCFIEEYCDGKYGANHDQWIGIDYLMSRNSL